MNKKKDNNRDSFDVSQTKLPANSFEYFLLGDILYTARQLCGITLLFPLPCLTGVGNLYQCQSKTTGNIQKTFRLHPINSYGRPSYLSCPSQPSFLGMLISPSITKPVWHIQLWTIAVCKLPSEIKVIIMLTNIRPINIENIVRLSGLGLSQREMSRIPGVPSKESYTVFVRAAVLPRDYPGFYCRW